MQIIKNSGTVRALAFCKAYTIAIVAEPLFIGATMFI
jgi:hypothetical protein